MNKGKLIIFEGPDFSGKSTQIKLLKPALVKNNNILYCSLPCYSRCSYGYVQSKKGRQKSNVRSNS